MKRLLFISVLITMGLALCAQTREHIVARAETVKSIAQMYNISEEALIEANPNLSKFIYVGMKLVIPDAAKAVAEEPVKSKAETPVQAPAKAVAEAAPAKVGTAPTAAPEVYETPSESKSRLVFTSGNMWIFPLTDKVDGFKSMNMGFNTCFGVGYIFNDLIFVDANIGYGYVTSKTWTESGSSAYQALGNYDVETTSHSIVLPLRAGVVIGGGFEFYTGPHFNLPLVTKVKTTTGLGKNKNEDTKKVTSNEVSVSLPIGIGFGYDGLFLSLEYIVGLKEGSNNAWSIGIRGGF